MATEREPPPFGDGKPTEFEELEDGEDLFISTVSTLEVRRKWSWFVHFSLFLELLISSPRAAAGWL